MERECANLQLETSSLSLQQSQRFSDYQSSLNESTIQNDSTKLLSDIISSHFVE